MLTLNKWQSRTPKGRTVCLVFLWALSLWAGIAIVVSGGLLTQVPVCRLAVLDDLPLRASLRPANPLAEHVPFDDAFDAYVQMHVRALNQPHKQKYLEVHLEKSGLGNRLSLFVTGIVLAMLTGRVALMVDKTGFLSQVTTPVDFRMPSALFLHTRTPHAYRAAERIFHSPAMLPALVLDDLEGKYGNAHWVIGKWDYYLPLLQANENYNRTLQRWFPDGQVAYHVLRRALRVNARIDERAKKFAEANFTGFTVGVHMRRHKFDAAPPSAFANAALNIGTFASTNPLNVTYFVAADDEEARGGMSQLLTDVRYNTEIAWGDEGANGDPGGSDQAALLDLRLLSMCDELVITYGSSFGQWAASWGGRRYTTVMPSANADHTNDREANFWGSSTSEPCSYNVRRLVHQAQEGVGADVATANVRKRYRKASAALLAARNTAHHLQCHPYTR